MPKSHSRPVWLVAALAAGLLLLSALLPGAPQTNFVPPEYPGLNPNANGGRLISGSLTGLPGKKVHALHAIAIGKGLFAVWYGGSKEARPDVAIYAAHYDGTGFGEPRRILDSSKVMQDQRAYNHTLGNPVLWKDADTLWLFAAQVPVGGWSGSQVLVMQSPDLGRSWRRSRFYVTSPFINISTLPKSQPLALDGGYLALPVYHELVNQRSELLVLDRKMRLADKRWLSRAADGRLIQPVTQPINTAEAIALHRSMDPASPYVHLSATSDGGNHWSKARPLSLPNPDAAIHLLALKPELWLLIYNHSRKNRQSMDLAISRNQGRNWRRFHTLARVSKGRLGYPWMVVTEDGVIHAFYTRNRTSFDHHKFDLAWIRRRAA